MNHFLDIHKTDPVALRSMIDHARAMKDARGTRPRGMPDDDQPLLVLENYVGQVIPKQRAAARRIGAGGNDGKLLA